jgi:hypothetical protein
MICRLHVFSARFTYSSMEPFMKKFALPLVLAATVALQACNQPAEPEAAASSADVALDNTTQRLSYGIAYGLGQRMAADGVPMDVPAFSAGLKDAMEGADPRMTEEEIQEEMMAYQQRAMEEQQALAAAAAEANQAAADAFLAEKRHPRRRSGHRVRPAV